MRCRTSGKACFRTHKSATHALRDCEIQRRLMHRVWRMERGIYLCRHCDQWHLTSKP